jgi:Ca-activated chloride channel family protein
MNVCAIALVLLLDASPSVSEASWALQRDLTADALEHPAVAHVIDGMTDDVVVAVASFATRTKILIPWKHIKKPEDRAEFILEMRGITRTDEGGSTNIFRALDASFNLLDEAPCMAHERVIDISTDGVVSNYETGNIERKRDDAETKGIKINAIGFLSVDTEDEFRKLGNFLENSLRTNNGFSVITQDWQGYAAAIRRKIIKEVASR